MMGIGNAGMWGPLATTATRTLPMSQAGAGAGIYNTTRVIGSVIGSAAIAAFMQSRLEANLPGIGDAAVGFDGGALPPAVVDGFAAAMAQAILLPAATLLIGVVAVLFLQRRTPSGEAAWRKANEELETDAADDRGASAVSS
jgi:MFS family permease